MKLHSLILIPMLLMAALSCTGNLQVQHGTSIRFGEKPLTSKAGEVMLEKDFTVYGMESTARGQANVFNWYNVSYDIGGYRYEGLTSALGQTQAIKYWNPEADNYIFYAFTGNDLEPEAADFNGGSVTLEDITSAKQVMLAIPSRNSLDKEDIGQLVMLHFTRLNSMLRFSLYEKDGLYDVKNMQIGVRGNYAYSASFFFSADGLELVAGSAQVLENAQVVESCSFPTLAKTAASAPEISCTPGFEVLPIACGPLTLTIHSYTLVNLSTGEETEITSGVTATIAAEYCNWQPNTLHNYILEFKPDPEEPQGGQLLFSADHQGIINDPEEFEW
ncbi:MAG: hypothetical protein MJY92_07165 [Bacteroidales bacterium]|nr:hypothetical protein [Bacteroidales bacterium]